ncbi:UNVERIFIED_CONTAM: hypothetical protein B566_EDAN018837 [Ephemera danica]|nr:hypothetical protein B566_EDAN018837 [Ephemera danica]
MGRHCESKVNFCESSPCQNGGACTSTASEYSSALYPSTRYSTRSMILPLQLFLCPGLDWQTV